MEEAIKLYEKARLLGCYSSIYNLGMIYFYGDNIEADPEKGISYLEEAERISPNENALKALCEIYAREDYSYDKKGIKYLEKYQHFGDKKVLLYLYHKYKNGLGVDTDLNKAFLSLFKYYLITRDHSLLELKGIIQKYNVIKWNKEQHFVWGYFEINQKIVTILLISKCAPKSSNYLLKSIFVKGIAMKIIEYLVYNEKFNKEESKN